MSLKEGLEVRREIRRHPGNCRADIGLNSDQLSPNSAAIPPVSVPSPLVRECHDHDLVSQFSVHELEGEPSQTDDPARCRVRRPRLRKVPDPVGHTTDLVLETPAQTG